MQQGVQSRAGESEVQMFASSGGRTRGTHGKRIYRKRVIGTVCQYPEAASARKAITGLLREISPNPAAKVSPNDGCGVCDHFIQRELTN
jgi:hypothetical protein